MAAAIVLLFATFYVHLWLTVNPRLIHHNQGPVFLIGFGFFKNFLSQPGGPLDYVSLLVSQLFHFPWAGALVITIVAALICLAGRGLLTAAGGQRPNPAMCLVPALLIMLIYSRYGADFEALLQILAALWLANLYASLPLRRWPLRLAWFLPISIAAYYLAGSGYVLFAVLCGILELLGRRRILLGLVMLLCGPAAPYACAIYSYQVALPEAYAPLLPVGKKMLVALAPPFWFRRALHLALVLLFPLAAAWANLRTARAVASKAARRMLSRLRASVGRSAEKRVPRPKTTPTPGCGSLWPIAALALLVMVVPPISVDRLTRTLIEIDYAARNRMWQQVLDEAEALPLEYNGIYVMNAVNKALYETGRLPYEMFAHPQTIERDSVFLVFAVPGPQRGRYERLSEMFFDLGFMNEAEHFAHEALERHGQAPALLQRLAKINILKGLPVAARAFLSALAKNPLHRQWAKAYLRKLDVDPAMTGDDELRAARSRMIRLGYTNGSGGYDEQIGPLLVRGLEHKLRTDRRSKLAYEYLMAHYLLTRQLDKVVAGIRRLDSFGYLDIPTHYEEAILLHAVMRSEVRPQLYGRSISRKSLDNFREYGEVIQRLGRDKPAVYKALMKSHDRSYFLYFTVGFSDSRFASLSQEADTTTAATK